MNDEKTTFNGVTEIEKSDIYPLFPKRKSNTHKGTYGKVGVMGGSVNYTGAVKLCNIALTSLLSGAGLSVVIAPEEEKDSFLPYLVDSTFYPFPSENGETVFDKEAIDKALFGLNVLVLGSGWNKSIDKIKILEYIVKNFEGKLVLDADGINMLAENLDILLDKKCKIVLTPHLKEFSRLIRKDIKNLDDNVILQAKEFAKIYGVIVCVKSNVTVITDGDKAFLSCSGTPAMAKGGSGDVLAGIMGGMLAPTFIKSEDILIRAAAACYINGLAGETAAKSTGAYSLLASDTAFAVREVVKEFSEIALQ